MTFGQPLALSCHWPWQEHQDPPSSKLEPYYQLWRSCYPFCFWFIVMSGVNSKGLCFLLTICQSLKIHLGFEVLIRIMRVLCQRVNVLHVWAKYGELSEVDYDLIKNNILLFYNKYKLKIVLEYSNSMNS